MKKRIFTLFIAGFLLAGAFSTVKAQQTVVLGGGDVYDFNFPVTITTERPVNYVFSNCPFNVDFNFDQGLWSGSWGGINARHDTIAISVNGARVTQRIFGENIIGASKLSFSVNPGNVTPGQDITVSFEYIIPTGNAGAGSYDLGFHKYSVMNYPSVSTTFDGKDIYDYYYDRTTLFPGKVEISRKGGSPDLQYSVDGFHWKPFPNETLSLPEIDIQNLIPGSEILVKEPYGCGGGIPFIDVPEHQGILGGIISRPIYIGPVENATVIPSTSGVGMTHFVPSGKNFVFKIQPTGPNEGLKPEVTTAETRYLPEGVEGITYNESEPGVWTVTILGVQQSLNVNISFPVETESGATKTPAIKDDGSFQTYGVAGAVKVFNAVGVIELYTIDGRKYKSVPATGGEQTIAIPRGLIIVKNSGKAVKLVVK
jgi:hypothetical protein